jgi:hypothetical protein
MERMKIICESILAKKLDVDSVVSTLTLDDCLYHCNKLKSNMLALSLITLQIECWMIDL